MTRDRMRVQRLSLVAALLTCGSLLTLAGAAGAEESGSVVGTVTDPDGVPLVNVEVRLALPGALVVSDWTDAAGAYALLDVQPGDYLLEVYPYPYPDLLAWWFDGASHYEDASLLTVGTGETRVDVELQRGGEVAGTVTDPDGDPAANVRVEAQGPGYGQAYTDASGDYRIKGLVPGDYRIAFSSVASTGLIGEFYDDQERWEWATLLPVDIGSAYAGIDAQLARGATISGTVLRADGGPAAGVSVRADRLDGPGGSYWATTRVDGTYALSLLPDGIYELSFNPAFGSGLVGEYYDSVLDVAEGASLTGVDAELALAGRLMGTVTTPSGYPAIAVSVRVQRMIGQPYYDASTVTSRDGTYQFIGLPAGYYSVCFEPLAASGLAPKCYDDQPFDWWEPDVATPVLVLEGGSTTVDEQLEAAVEPGVGYLRVSTDPAVPAQISVDFEWRDSWGLTWLKLEPGWYDVCFADVPGYTTPPCQLVGITQGAISEVVGSYEQRGWLRVLTNPALPATVSVDGMPRNDWGMWTDMPPGTYEVCFGAVAGYLAPPCQLATVVAGQTATLVGTYLSSPGMPGPSEPHGFLRVSTQPGVPTQILLDGKPMDTWGLTWVKVPPGTYTVAFTDVAGFETPPSQLVTVSAGQTVDVAGVFRQRGWLRVLTDPALSSTVMVDGIPRNDWGLWTDVPTGVHEVCWSSAEGQSAPACQVVVAEAGQTTQVTGSFVSP